MSIAANPSIQKLLWIQNRMMESPIGSPQREEWKKIVREVEQTAQRFWQEKTPSREGR